MKAKITVDYEKIAQQIKEDKVNAEYRRIESKDAVQESQSWNEIHKVYDKLVETGAVKMDIQQGIPNAGSDKMSELMFKIFGQVYHSGG